MYLVLGKAWFKVYPKHRSSGPYFLDYKDL